MQGLVVGVDVGASRVRAVVLDAAGRERARAERSSAEAPAERLERLVGAASDALRTVGAEAPAEALCAGVAGVGDAAARRALRSALLERSVAKEVRVTTDAEAAHFDAFAGESGILLAAGTGSVAWGRGPGGREGRSGGLGPLLGDEGSGWYLARRGLSAAARAADGRAPPTRLLPLLAEGLGARTEARGLVTAAEGRTRAGLSALAPLVLEAGREGDAAAAAITASAAAELALHVTSLAERLGPWTEPVPVALTGGLLREGPFRGRVVAALGGDVRTRPGVAQGARGAARMLLDRRSSARG